MIGVLNQSESENPNDYSYSAFLCLCIFTTQARLNSILKYVAQLFFFNK